MCNALRQVLLELGGQALCDGFRHVVDGNAAALASERVLL